MKQRNGTVDFLKFIFAVLIVMFHSKNLATGVEESYFIGGSIGVDFFFLVSGFFLASSALKKPYLNEKSLGEDTFEFMKHKIAGLMPNYYVAWTIAFAVFHIVQTSTLKIIIKDGVSAFFELLLISETGIIGYKANGVTWYLSAMLIAMLIIYPLIRKYKEIFFYVIGPLIVLFILGIAFQEFKDLRTAHAWVFGFIFKGMLRAISEITFGAIIYKMSQALRQVEFTIVSKIIFTVIEVLAFSGVILYVFDHRGSKFDWYLVFALAIGVLLAASSVSYTAKIFRGRVFTWLGEYSLSLYLGHGFWSKVFNDIPIIGTMPYYQKVYVYLAVAIVTGLAIMYISKLISYIWRVRKNAIKCVFIK